MRTATEIKSKRFGFLIFQGFPMACLTSMIEPLRAANEILGKSAFTWQLIGETNEPITSSANLGFNPDIALADIGELDYLFLLGTPQSGFATPKSSNGMLRRLVRYGVLIGSISGGAFPLARTGLLDGYTSSVHWSYRAAFEAEFPQIETIDDVIFCDRKRVTISGAAAGFDAMLNLIEKQYGSKIVTQIACWFQHPMVRGAHVKQRVPLISSNKTNDMLPNSIQKAVQIFSEGFDDPISVTIVAETVGLSLRHMERKFKQSTGQSPSRFYRSKRMNAARQLVLFSKENLSSIAVSVGYSITPMKKYYKEEFGLTPLEDREKVNMFSSIDTPSLHPDQFRIVDQVTL